MKGTICDIINLGSIVQVITEDESQSLYFDHRMFQHFLDDVCGEDATAEDLLGLEIESDGEEVKLQERR